jgi:hypothetical protein
MQIRAGRRPWPWPLLLCGVVAATASGCLGDHFAGVTLANRCGADVMVATDGSEWSTLAAGEQREFLINAPPDPERFIAVAVRADALGEPVGVELSDGSRMRLTGPLCPAPTP